MYAVIDIGSNTIRLSLYDVQNDSITLLANKKVTVGLAGYIQDGHMSPGGIQRGADALAELTKFLSYVQIRKLICFATAPLRGIDNVDEVKAEFEKVCNSPITVLSGEEEAEIDFLGAKQNLVDDEGLVVDIGGGSTELVYYAGGRMQSVQSIPFGSLVMYRSCVQDILPTGEEMTDILDRIGTELAHLPVPGPVPVICGIGGTVRGCGKLLKHLLHDKKKANQYAPEDIDHLLKMERTELVDLILREVPDRIHTIIPGSCILLAVANHFHAKKIHVSRTGVREGCLIQYLGKEER